MSNQQANQHVRTLKRDFLDSFCVSDNFGVIAPFLARKFNYV